MHSGLFGCIVEEFYTCVAKTRDTLYKIRFRADFFWSGILQIRGCITCNCTYSSRFII